MSKEVLPPNLEKAEIGDYTISLDILSSELDISCSGYWQPLSDTSCHSLLLQSADIFCNE